MATIIAFPQHRGSQVYADTLPEAATPKEEAIFRVRRLRAERDRHTPAQRRYHMAGIMLKWWEDELARVVGATAAVHQLREGR